MEILSTQKISKKFNNFTAVKSLSLQVQAGGLTAFLGPNGAGKSTTIAMLTGFLKPTAGQILFKKQPLQLENYHQRIGLVAQNSLLDPELSVWDNLVFRAKMYPRCSIERVASLLQLVDATSFQKQKYGLISGGQKRRVDIARALLNQPEILFLDEPTTGLDIQTRTLIWQLLQQLQQEQHLTIFLTTHYLNEAEAADQVYILDHGEVVAKGSVKALKRQYAPNNLWIETPKQHELLTFLNRRYPDLNYQAINPQEVKISIKESTQALAILQQAEQYVADFAYQKGQMDDVFLNLTGKEIRNNA